MEYIWEEVDNISSITSQNTIVSSEKIDENTLQKEYNWSNLYGELGNGEYYFSLYVENLSYIKIYFSINEDGLVTYNEPTLEY